MSLHDRVDPDCLPPLRQLLTALPGGLNAVADVTARRAVFDAMVAEMTKDLAVDERIAISDHTVAGLDGDPDLWVRVYRPLDADGRPAGPVAGVVSIHGGGMVIGNVASDQRGCLALCQALGCVVVSVEYRLAPEHPHPAAVRDCTAALRWTAANADTLGIDPARIALYGVSAGGGLALGTALMVRDHGGPAVTFVMAIYPMIDDRNVTPSSHEIVDLGIWDRAGNIEAWSWYLGGRPADAYGAPARADDLRGLPPTFIDVGELDLFRDEDIAFANRLLQAGVPTELHVYPGAFHGSESFAPEAALSRRIVATRHDALRRALG
jgi:acetyl esterase/lipase